MSATVTKVMNHLTTEKNVLTRMNAHMSSNVDKTMLFLDVSTLKVPTGVSVITVSN